MLKTRSDGIGTSVVQQRPPTLTVPLVFTENVTSVIPVDYEVASDRVAPALGVLHGHIPRQGAHDYHNVGTRKSESGNIRFYEASAVPNRQGQRLFR